MYVDKIPVGNNIGPLTQLENGSPVRVGNKTGYVFRSELLPAHPCGSIVVHEIRLTKKIVKVSPRRYKISDIKETIKPNYSSVYFLD